MEEGNNLIFYLCKQHNLIKAKSLSPRDCLLCSGSKLQSQSVEAKKWKRDCCTVLPLYFATAMTIFQSGGLYYDSVVKLK